MVAGSAAGQGSADPNAVLALIRRLGPARAIDTLSEDARAWPAILDGIASGGARWLAVFDATIGNYNAAASEQLGDAYLEAFPRAPVRLLRRAGRRIADPDSAVSGLCGNDAAGYGDDRLLARYITQSRRALVPLRAAPGRRLRELAEACARRFDELEAALARALPAN